MGEMGVGGQGERIYLTTPPSLSTQPSIRQRKHALPDTRQNKFPPTATSVEYTHAAKRINRSMYDCNDDDDDTDENNEAEITDQVNAMRPTD